MFARLLTIAVACLLVAGCEKTDHESIEKWTRTRKGYDKLKKAMTDEGIDADLSAHAAANLVKTQKDADVRAALDAMSPGRRAQIVGKLAPKLWDMARLENENALPGPQHIGAKDALVNLRKHADEAQRQTIDGYLIDWYAVPSYEGRAGAGAVIGAAVIRMIGPSGGKKLMSVANSVIAAPGQEKRKNRIGDELLLGLAASGNPEAVKYVLDIVKMDRGDDTLPKRAMTALYKAYIDPGGLFDLLPPDALQPNLDQLVALAKDDSLPNQVINDALALIGVIGPPHCQAPLIAMVKAPHRDARFKFVAANSALKCGGGKAVAEVVRALPDSGAYFHDDVKVLLVDQISRSGPRDATLAGLRELTKDRSTVARWVALEALVAMKSKEDLGRISAQAGDKSRLVGYWGERNPEGKADPTLGQRAKELVAQLTQTPP